ncbi:MAG TPA: aminotransferase class V-fold PLP-dependent enzyme [Solirubrobacteraceae bacterium]|nr:aminotransferase class V-fold PLP-dependent enzyme [Solirubrobacteraceae bacterium]
MTESLTSATDPTTFRAQFPVLERLSYLNAGTEGPVPAAACETVHLRIDLECDDGRCGRPYFEETMGLRDRARAGYASVLGCDATEVALTGSTTDGVNTVIGGLDLRPGDEILTTDQEHPGLLAPLARARLRHGIDVRVVPFAELAGEVSPNTRLIACSHVSWVGGEIADVPALVATGVPVLLDAAQALGAVPVNVCELGVDFYAASGQKWLCGPEGSGCLYVRPDRLDDLLVPWPGYSSLADSHNPLESDWAEGVARLDHGFPAGMRNGWALASLGVFEAAGWDWVHDRAATLAAGLADRLSERGLAVRPRGRSTLVSWHVDDADAEVARLAEERVIVRSIPAFSLVRASVGAWSSEEELERLVQLVAA